MTQADSSTTNTINRNLALLYPPFREMVEKGLAEAHAAGLMAYVFEGFRSMERQAMLYAQGRTAPGNVVTWAKPGQTWHNYGLAVDLVWDKDPAREGIQWSWAGAYDRLATIMTAQGLEWLGATTSDKPHFQKKYGFTTAQAIAITSREGLLGLWKAIDKKLGV